jgi:hypothetical protein
MAAPVLGVNHRPTTGSIPQWKADKLRHEANYDAYWAKKAAQSPVVTSGVNA